MKKLYETESDWAGFTIKATNKGLKLEMWNCYSDKANFTFYVKETKEFNKNTDFSKKWNETMTYGEYYSEWVSECYGTPDQNKNIYRVVKSDQ